MRRAVPSPVIRTDDNVFVVLGTACEHLHQLRVPRDRIEKLYDDVAASGSYDAALALVERWFPVEKSDDG